MWFNVDTTAEGVEALRQYRTEYDERLKTFADTPHRDWTTDIADAARCMAIVARHIAPKAPPKADLPAGRPAAGPDHGSVHGHRGRADAAGQGLAACRT